MFEKQRDFARHSTCTSSMSILCTDVFSLSAHRLLVLAEHSTARRDTTANRHAECITLKIAFANRAI